MLYLAMMGITRHPGTERGFAGSSVNALHTRRTVLPYLDGALLQKDMTRGMAYMERAAQRGNAYAQLFVDRQDTLKPPSVMLSVSRLLRSMGQVFQDNSLPQSGAMQTRLDRKRMQEMIDLKGYEAARSYAREYQAEQEYSGMRMATPW